MRSSLWNAQGNVYLVADGESLTPERVRALVEGADGILEVFRYEDDWVEIAIWNPDGSRAEMSGNGTRIAAKWLSAQSGAQDVVVRVGPREVRTHICEDGRVEQELGAVSVAEPEEVDGIRLVAVDVGNPHAVIEGDPADLPRLGPVIEVHPRFPRRTNVQVARVVEPGVIEARVWERGAGETASSGTSAVAVAAALGLSPATVRFPGGELHVRLDGEKATLTGTAERVH